MRMSQWVMAITANSIHKSSALAHNRLYAKSRPLTDHVSQEQHDRLGGAQKTEAQSQAQGSLGYSQTRQTVIPQTVIPFSAMQRSSKKQNMPCLQENQNMTCFCRPMPARTLLLLKADSSNRLKEIQSSQRLNRLGNSLSDGQVNQDN